ncbi:MAG: glycosyltransferase family 1 protein [Chitinophagaceae bacterium]
MTIAVNTRFLLADYLEGYGNFIYESFKRITAAHPEHEFIFIFDRPYDKKFVFGANVKPVVTGPAARHPLLWKLWYDIKVPMVLRKYKADVFVSCDGFCSLSTSVPQCLVVHDLAFLHYPSFNQRSHLSFYKKYTPRFLAKARSVATVSGFSKKDIDEQYKIKIPEIDIVYSAAKNSFSPLSSIEMTAVKDKYTEGREFFLYTGAIHPRKNLMNLLKAFSIFKKRQQTNMKLVLVGRLAWKYDSFKKSLDSYKYREDVLMTGYIGEEELTKITASAYGLIYPSLWEGFGVPVLEAMQSAVPVITAAGSAMQEISNGAALYADVSSHTALADKMMLLYKDEKLRKELIQKGLEAVKEYSWDRTAQLLWQSIEKAAGKIPSR